MGMAGEGTAAVGVDGIKPAAEGGLPPDQRVLTPDGYRPASAMDSRDAVVTGRGRVRVLIAVHRRTVAEPLYRLCTVRGNVLRATGAQPVLARRGEGVPEWVPAAAIGAGDLVAVFGSTSLGGWARAGIPAGPAAGPTTAVVLREEAGTYVGLDWVPLASIDAAPYCGPLYALDVEEDHSLISEGWMLSACRGR